MREVSRAARGLMKFVWGLVLSIVKHDIASLAAVITFYALFSMFPLLLLMIYAASYLFPHSQIEYAVVTALGPYYPALPEARKFIAQNVSTLRTAGAKVGIISGISFTWSATSGFIAVQQAMDVIFDVHVHEQRSFVSRRLVAIATLLIMILLSVFSAVLMAVHPMDWLVSNPFIVRWLPLVQRASRILFPISLFITCYIFYRFFSSRNLEPVYVLCGAFIATLALDGARFVFTHYASSLVTYHILYGGLETVMVLILWMYIASMMMLFGAEVAASLRSFYTTE
jgi:membrane protein